MRKLILSVLAISLVTGSRRPRLADRRTEDALRHRHRGREAAGGLQPAARPSSRRSKPAWSDVAAGKKPVVEPEPYQQKLTSSRRRG